MLVPNFTLVGKLNSIAFQVASVSQTLGRLFLLAAVEDGLLQAESVEKMEDEEMRESFGQLLKQLDELKPDGTEFVLLRNILILKGKSFQAPPSPPNHFRFREASPSHPFRSIPPGPTSLGGLSRSTYASISVRFPNRLSQPTGQQQDVVLTERGAKRRD